MRATTLRTEVAGLTALTLFCVLSVNGRAYANCAMPNTYHATVQGNTVTICPSNLQERVCPDPEGLLRVDSTGSAVKLPDHCSSNSGGTSCYVDECVAQGKYQYGLARPYSCCASCCGTDYYVDVVVSSELATECTELGDAGSSETPASAPWSTERVICNYGLEDAEDAGPVQQQPDSGQANTGQANTGQPVQQQPDSGQQPSKPDTGSPPASSEASDCSCRLPGRSGAAGLVLSLNAFLVLLGLVRSRRRQNQ
jgi:hypothetical protein